jgi:Carbohydrate esterase, sialic acid-specific acetylesterase
MKPRWLVPGLAALVIGVVIGVAFGATRYRAHRADQRLAAQMAQIEPGTSAQRLGCDALAAGHPLVLLALGQSLAGNHSEPSLPREPVHLFYDGHCLIAQDPLPGGTGRGGSIWPLLAALLQRPVVISVLAVDATSIDEWTRPSSPLRHRLATHIAAMRGENLAPSLVLWQQGEADARGGTSAKSYRAGLAMLNSILSTAGSAAPILLARSTVCRSAPSAAIRRAVQEQVEADGRFRLGPDTDALVGPGERIDGCHLSGAGLRQAARLWKDVIETEAQRLATTTNR